MASGGGVASRMQRRRAPRIRIERVPREKAARVRLGSYEFKKKGISRFDLRDPYHLAIALTWPQFPAALLALYLAGSRFVPRQNAEPGYCPRG